MGIQIEKMGAASKKIIITCTYDRTFSKYYTNERISPNAEVTTNIVNLINQGFNYFKTLYKIYPKRAFIYRSGVSDEEKKKVYVQEIQAIEKFFNSLENNFQYVFTIVNKKNDMKFFVIDGNDLHNPQDGTVLDDTVTAFGQYEFYLQNQFVNQGCATPTHYHVLKATLPIPQEALQEITYHMSYYYWNWNGPIRLPACLKFAETYCKFIGTTNGSSGYLDIMERLRNKPYYI